MASLSPPQAEGTVTANTRFFNTYHLRLTAAHTSSRRSSPSKKITVMESERQGRPQPSGGSCNRNNAPINRDAHVTSSFGHLAVRDTTPPPTYKRTASPPSTPSRPSRRYHGRPGHNFPSPPSSRNLLSPPSSRPPTPPTPTGSFVTLVGPPVPPPIVSVNGDHKYYVVTCGRRTGVFNSWYVLPFTLIKL